MRLLSLKSGVCAFIASASLAVFAADQSDAVKPQRDIAIALAEFERYKGNGDRALLTLDTASTFYPVSDNSERLIYKAELFVEQKRFQDAKGLFDQLLVKSKAVELMQKVAFPLAELNFANENCTKALRLLKVKKDKTVDQQQQAFFMRATCLVASEEVDLQQLADLDQQMQQYAEEVGSNRLGLWMAYSYYNLSLASLNSGMLTDAAVYFDRVFQYINVASLANDAIAEEAKALRERALLTVAGSYFSANQYGLAMEYYSLLALDGYWNDQALLGYGWSAFNNFERGLALEAWRQLAYLPNKSMSVYEGLLAIPYALEKANAYSRALTAYDTAVNEFNTAITEIALLKQTLTREKIKEHALEYANSQGRAIKPLHPLLGFTYTQPKFSAAVARLGEVAAEQRQLEVQRKEIAILAQIAGWQRGESNAEIDAEQALLKRRLEAFFKKIVNLRELMLLDAIANNLVDEQFKNKYNRYLALKRISTANAQVGHERLEKLQGVLFWQMLEQPNYPKLRLTAINELISLHTRLLQRMEGFKKTIEIAETGRPEVSELVALQQKISVVEKNSIEVSVRAEQHLLDMTLTALDEFTVVLDAYQKQARVAAARLREEFYQLGGRRL